MAGRIQEHGALQEADLPSTWNRSNEGGPSSATLCVMVREGERRRPGRRDWLSRLACVLGGHPVFSLATQGRPMRWIELQET